jgi:hypothetical protein
MNITFKQIITSDLFIFACAIIIGFSLWTMLSHHQIIQQTIKLPVVVYEKQTVVHQSALTARIEGTRLQLHALNNQPSQVTFYREEHPEKQIVITPGDVLLPETITLIDYEPKSIYV